MKLNDFSFQNRHELIANRGDLTESLESRAFAPNVNFYPRGGADDLETRELEDSWLIARGLSFLPNRGWLDYNSTLNIGRKGTGSLQLIERSVAYLRLSHTHCPFLLVKIQMPLLLLVACPLFQFRIPSRQCV